MYFSSQVGLTWGRMWALYLGRPYTIRLDDVTVARATNKMEAPPFDMVIAEAWSSLMEIVGRICDAL